jgi:hypothetical protein
MRSRNFAVVFAVGPGSPVTVEPIPAFFAQRSLIDDEAIVYHEGIPGHHVQRSVAQQLEGWALYAEQLGKEIGFLQDPFSDYGRRDGAIHCLADRWLQAQKQSM